MIKKVIKKTVKLLKFIDSHFLKGKLERKLDIWSIKRSSKFPDDSHLFLRNGIPASFESLDIRFSKVIRIATSDLLYLQYASPYIDTKYLRYDIPFLHINPKKTGGAGIIVDQDFQIIKGVENFVNQMDNHQEFVDVKINYVDEWDKKKLFDLYKIVYREQLDNSTKLKCDENIKSILTTHQYPFVLVLWPSSENVWSSIENDIADVRGIKIIGTQIKHYTRKELLGFMDACYLYAGIPPYVLNAKKTVVVDGCNPQSSDYPVKLITIQVDNPHYTIDSETGQPFSLLQKELKMNIRSRYWNRVPNYGYDNIIHGTDNYVQSKLLIELSKVNSDVSDLYKLLDANKCNYSIIKRTKESRPETNDPIVNNRIIFNSDIDILTTDDEIQKVFDLVKTFASQHFVGDWLYIEEEKVHFNHGEKYNRFLWVRLKDFNVVLFHIQSRLYGLTPQFLSECLDNRHKDNVQYVIDMPNYEVYLRLADLLEHPEKTHHLEYVQLNYNLITMEGLCRAFGNDYAKEIQNKLKEYICK